jgi:hypothetical protein
MIRIGKSMRLQLAQFQLWEFSMFKRKQINFKFMTGVAAATIGAFILVPIATNIDANSLMGINTAKAAGEGSGSGGSGKGSGGSGGGHSDGGSGGGHSDGGSGGGHSDGGTKGQKGGKAGSGGGEKITGKDLGRLNMARAFLSPGFDASKIDDPEAPLMQIIAYKDAVEAGDEDAAILALAKAATAPIKPSTITKLNKILGISEFKWDVEDFAAAAEAKNKELREEE